MTRLLWRLIDHALEPVQLTIGAVLLGAAVGLSAGWVAAAVLDLCWSTP